MRERSNHVVRAQPEVAGYASRVRRTCPVAISHAILVARQCDV